MPWGRHVLGVDAAAPEDDVLAEVPLELDRVHARGPDMHRVQDVHAQLDEVGQQRADVAARVEEELRVRRELMDAAGTERASRGFISRRNIRGEISCETCVP